MRKLKRFFGCALLSSMLMSQIVYANTPTWEQLSKTHRASVLLPASVTQNQDIQMGDARGIRLATCILRIYNGEDGTIKISVDTAAHKNIDVIYQTVFLDEWDDEREDWVQVGYWEFEKHKEEENGELSSYHVDLTVSGCQVNHYYRARAMHLVQWGDDMEGKATETDGVLLTNK